MYQNFAIDAAWDEAIDAAQPRRRSQRSGQSRRSHPGGSNCQERFDGCVSLGPRSVTVCDECRRECHNHGRWPFDKCPPPGSRTPATRFDTYDDFDAFEDALVDALDEEDTDEFFRRLARGIGRVARGIGRGIGRVARVVAPIASLIPLPFTQAIGRVANIAGRLLADGADEFEAIDALVDLAEDEDLWDAAAPAIATMAVHGVMPQAARLPPAARKQLVRATTQTAQALVQRQGPQSARVLPAVVQTAQRVVRQQQLPAQALPQVIRQVGNRLSRNPQRVNQLLRSTSPATTPHRCTCGHRVQGRRIAR